MSISSGQMKLAIVHGCRYNVGVSGAGFHRIYDYMLQEGARVEDQSTSIHNFSLLLINKRQLYFFFSIIIYSNDTAPFFCFVIKEKRKTLGQWEMLKALREKRRSLRCNTHPY